MLSKPQKTVIFLGLLFILPVLLSTVYFYYVSNFGSLSRVNYGKLINPAIKTDRNHLILSNTTGEISEQRLNKKWTLTFINMAGKCEKICQENIGRLVRIRSLTNEDVERIQVALFSSLPDETTDNLLKKHKNLVLLQPDKKAFENFFTKHWQDKTNTIVLLDPLGNILLQYPIENLDIKKTLRDLLRLLKYSRIG